MPTDISSSYYSMTARIWDHLSARRRFQLNGVLVLTLIASVAEILTIGTVLPFLTAMVNPEKITQISGLKPLLDDFGVRSPEELRLPLTILFCSGIAISGMVRLALVWFQSRLSGAIGADFSLRVYERTLYQPYTVHTSRNSSAIHAGIGKAQGLVGAIINPTLSLISQSLMLTAVVSFLFWIDPLIATIAIGGISSIYLVVMRTTRGILQRNSSIVATSFTGLSRAAIEGLGGIRDILIDGLQPVYARLFRRSSLPLAKAQASNSMMHATPRLAVESLSIILIAALAYAMSQSDEGLFGAIPTLGALAVTAQRVFPMVQGVYQSITTIRANRQSTLDALELLDQPMPPANSPRDDVCKLSFAKGVQLSNLAFRYASDSPAVLRNINLIIPKGSRVGFVGETGSGKSTLLDILMGLLDATEGSLIVDGVPVNSYRLRRAWQAHIAHVPQSIFLTDDSIAANIAFGVEPKSIDMQRVAQAAQRAQIASTVDRWTAGYETKIGERGVRLSGGQRQRIGIARALYKQADVLIFDEATSALDNATEAEVMRAIDSLDKDLTIFMVAHRLTTLRGCDTIVELKDGRVARVGTYDEIIGAQSAQA